MEPIKNNGWTLIDINDASTLPDDGVVVIVYVPTHPEKFDDGYSKYKDGRDRTEDELAFRAMMRNWYAKNKIQKAYIYQTALNGKCWRVGEPAPDSRASFTEFPSSIRYWKPLPKEPQYEE